MVSTRSDSVAAIVLAAGKGTRMKSVLPKVLHPLSGTPMVGHVIKAIHALNISQICAVVGDEQDEVGAYLQSLGSMTLALQKARLGTGEAVACAGFAWADTNIPAYASGRALGGPTLTASHVLICAGDTPALDSVVLREFLDDCSARQSRLAVLAMDHPQPFGYGRIILDGRGLLQAIVEEKDASPDEKAVRLCNSGVIFAERTHLFSLLQKLKPDNAQKEYYLTDCFRLAREGGAPADVFITPSYAAFDGVNDRVQLANLEERLQARLKEKWMRAGISFHLPQTTYIEESVTFAGDATIGPSCTLLGNTVIGRGSEIGSHTVLKNAIIPEHAHVPPGTVRLQPE